MMDLCRYKRDEFDQLLNATKKELSTWKNTTERKSTVKASRDVISKITSAILSRTLWFFARIEIEEEAPTPGGKSSKTN